MTHFNENDHPRAAGGQFTEKAQAEPAISLAAPVKPAKLPETQRKRRGHNFYPPKAVLSKIPALYETDGVPAAEQKIHAHYFVGGQDWFISELNPENGLAFGYADLGMGGGEWGYISLPELEAAKGRGWQVVERDCHFGEPKGLEEASKYTSNPWTPREQDKDES